MLVAFFSWWYGPGWKQVAESFGPRLKSIANNFSVRQLLPTLFAPWRRIITQPGRSLEGRFRAMVDNMFSRVIGFFVRIGVLIAAITSLLVVAILTILELIFWPLLPLAIPGCVVLELML